MKYPVKHRHLQNYYSGRWVHPSIADLIKETMTLGIAHGITEGIAEGRRLQLSEMRCESCKHFFESPLNSKDGWCNSGSILKGRGVEKRFGCIHHERRKE